MPIDVEKKYEIICFSLLGIFILYSFHDFNMKNHEIINNNHEGHEHYPTTPPIVITLVYLFLIAIIVPNTIEQCSRLILYSCLLISLLFSFQSLSCNLLKIHCPKINFNEQTKIKR